jgi:tRNA-splicing endonuclease subunit Sen34
MPTFSARCTNNTIITEIAVLVDDQTAHRLPSLPQLEAWNTERIAGVKAQIIAAEAKEAFGMSNARTMSEEAVRKRKEREEKRAAAARAKALAEGRDEEDVFVPPLDTSVQSGLAVAANPANQQGTPAAGVSSSNVTWSVTIPASSSTELQWYSSEDAMYSTIEDAKAAGIWTYPSTPFERAKCTVYQDLWEKGHFMGGGIRFGADFLVYPGRSSAGDHLKIRADCRKQVILCDTIPIFLPASLSRPQRA